jgi:uncharacterized protein YPO0396
MRTKCDRCDAVTARQDELVNENERLASELIKLTTEHPCYQLSKQLEKENEELRRLKDELSTAGQRGVDELAKENASLRADLALANDKLRWANQFLTSIANRDCTELDCECPEHAIEALERIKAKGELCD